VPAGGTGTVADPTAVRAAVADRLPDYMVPATVMRIETIPTTFHGKLDRDALPEPDFSGGSAPAAAGTLQRRVAEAVAGVLGSEAADGADPADAVGVDDDFFALGGHSLAAVRLANTLRAELGAEVSLRAVFDAPTVSSLAARIADTDAGGGDVGGGNMGGTARPALRMRPKPERIPLSPGQRRMWILDRIGVQPAAYAVPLVFTLPGGTDLAALEGALGELVRRHPTLRTLFPVDGDGADARPHQRVLAAEQVRVTLEVQDVTADPADPADPTGDADGSAVGGPADPVGAAAAALAARPFDLQREIPVRAAVLRCGDEQVLALVIHHIAVDEWSLRRLFGDLAEAYARRAGGTDADGGGPGGPRTVGGAGVECVEDAEGAAGRRRRAGEP